MNFNDLIALGKTSDAVFFVGFKDEVCLCQYVELANRVSLRDEE